MSQGPPSPALCSCPGRRVLPRHVWEGRTLWSTLDFLLFSPQTCFDFGKALGPWVLLPPWAPAPTLLILCKIPMGPRGGSVPLDGCHLLTQQHMGMGSARWVSPCPRLWACPTGHLLPAPAP